MKKRIVILSILSVLLGGAVNVQAAAALPAGHVVYKAKVYDLNAMRSDQQAAYARINRKPDIDPTKTEALDQFFEDKKPIRDMRPPVAPKKKPATAAAVAAPRMAQPAPSAVPGRGGLFAQINSMRKYDNDDAPAVAPAAAAAGVAPVVVPMRQKPAVAPRPARPLTQVAPGDMLPAKVDRNLHNEQMKEMQHTAADRFSRIGQQDETVRVKTNVLGTIAREDDDAASARLAAQLQAEEDAARGQAAAAMPAQPVGLLDDLRAMELQAAADRAARLAEEEAENERLLMALLEAEEAGAQGGAAAADDDAVGMLLEAEAIAGRIQMLQTAYETAFALMAMEDLALTIEDAIEQVLEGDLVVYGDALRAALALDNQRQAALDLLANAVRNQR